MSKDQSNNYLTSSSPKVFEIVEDNHPYYDKKWKTHKSPNKYAGWNWIAFILPPFWLSYRYMYGWTAIFFIMIIVELFLILALTFSNELPFMYPILTHLFFGLKGNAFFTKRVMKLIQYSDSEQENSKPVAPLFTKKGKSWISAIVTPSTMVFLLILPIQAISEWSFGSSIDPGTYVHSDKDSTLEYQRDLVTSPVFNKYEARINLLYFGEEPVNNRPFQVSLFFHPPGEPDEWELINEREYSIFSSNRVSLDLIDAEDPATKVGEYRVEISIDEKFIGEEEFTVTMD